MTGIQLIVGLCNPGAQYAETRHNAGAWFVDLLAKNHHANWRINKKLQAEIALVTLSCEEKLILAKPITFMNLSGRAIVATANFYKIPEQHILVAHDELDFPPGVAKIKYSGGHGGHNGLRDTITCLHTRDFYRLRIGIGRPAHSHLVTSFVLGTPNQSDQQRIEDACAEAAVVIPELASGEFDKACHHLHSKSSLH